MRSITREHLILRFCESCRYLESVKQLLGFSIEVLRSIVLKRLDDRFTNGLEVISQTSHKSIRNRGHECAMLSPRQS